MADINNSTSKFPAPYINSVNEDDGGVIVRVDQNKSEIGTRGSSLPKTLMTEKMGIDHVGGTI